MMAAMSPKMGKQAGKTSPSLPDRILVTGLKLPQARQRTYAIIWLESVDMATSGSKGGGENEDLAKGDKIARPD